MSLFPLACFISCVLSVPFLDQHALPTNGFLLGPEAATVHAKAAKRTRRGRSGATRGAHARSPRVRGARIIMWKEPPSSVGPRGAGESTVIPASTIERLIRADKEHDCHFDFGVCLRIAAVANLPTRFGDFQVVAFDSPPDQKEHAALVKGDITGQEDVPVRLHSECLTGDAFGSLRCDCREQLEQALEAISKLDHGIILYLRQEGRGIGFANKIRAYQLQEKGYDTNQANEALGFRADERDYAIAAHMLQSLRVKSIRLMSNNPRKIADLKHHGVKVNGRIPIIIRANPHNEFYLETKRTKSGHMLDAETTSIVPEQVDPARESDEAR